jgi:hypothetical protein
LDLLLGIPILTDQGSALKVLVKEFGLKWKLCHRHILENMGANSRIGRWAGRILRCFSPRQYRRTRKMIQDEMKSYQFDETDAAFKNLKRLLGELSDDEPLSDIRCWALFWRVGCPRTTNSAESVNGHLNGQIREGEDFVARVLSVANHFIVRYQSRNTWRNRALKRNRTRCFADRNDPGYCAAEELWYRHLHDVVDKDLTARLADQFPPEDRTCFFRADALIFTPNDSVSLPKDWAIDGPIKRGKTQGSIEGDTAPEALPLYEKSARTLLSYIAWQISWDLRKNMGPAKWKRYGQRVNTEVICLTTTLGIGSDSVPFKKEVA